MQIHPRIIFIPLILLGCLRTLAVDKVWKVNGNGVWGTSGRWTPSGVPGSGDRAIFGVTPTAGNEPVVASTRIVDALVVQNSASVTLTATAGTLQITTAGVPDIEIQLGSSLTLNGAIQGTGASGLDLDVAGNLTIQSGSTISSSESMALIGGGTLALNGGNLAPTGGVNVGEGTSLVGNGTIAGDLIFVDGRLSPGGDGLIGTINVTGKFSSSGSNTWVFDAVSGSQTDLVSVTGNLDVSGFTLDLSGVSAGSYAPGDRIVIADYGGTQAGTFNAPGLPTGWNIDYTGGEIALVAGVPEISHATPLLAALLPLFGLRKRR